MPVQQKPPKCADDPRSHSLRARQRFADMTVDRSPDSKETTSQRVQRAARQVDREMLEEVHEMLRFLCGGSS